MPALSTYPVSDGLLATLLNEHPRAPRAASPFGTLPDERLRQADHSRLLSIGYAVRPAAGRSTVEPSAAEQAEQVFQQYLPHLRLALETISQQFVEMAATVYAGYEPLPVLQTAALVAFAHLQRGAEYVEVSLTPEQTLYTCGRRPDGQGAVYIAVLLNPKVDPAVLTGDADLDDNTTVMSYDGQGQLLHSDEGFLLTVLNRLNA